jgi:hypothetical protein
MKKIRVIGGVMLSILALSASGSATAPPPVNPVIITAIEEDLNQAGQNGSEPDHPIVFVSLATPPNNLPVPCASNTLKIALDPLIPIDQLKAMTALLTSAFLAGKTVKFGMNGACTIALGINPNNVALVDSVIISSGT